MELPLSPTTLWLFSVNYPIQHQDSRGAGSDDVALPLSCHQAMGRQGDCPMLSRGVGVGVQCWPPVAAGLLQSDLSQGRWEVRKTGVPLLEAQDPMETRGGWRDGGMEDLWLLQ